MIPPPDRPPDPAVPPELAAAPLVSVCSWCQSAGKGPASAPGQTHGICDEHAREMLGEMGP